MHKYFTIILLILCCACGTTNTKISAWPAKVGFTKNQTVLLTPLEGVAENQSQYILDDATEQLRKKLTGIVIKDFWDADYQRRQAGLTFPAFSNATPPNGKQLAEKLNVNFILVSTVDRVRENEWQSGDNPNYLVREAIVKLKLIDVSSNSEIWSCITRVTANPLKTGKDSAVNIRSGESAVNIAYRKSIEKLIASSSMNPK